MASDTPKLCDNQTVAPWKPWSVPVDPLSARRKIYGWLNRLAEGNFPSISKKLIHFSTTAQRNQDPVIAMVAENILVWVALDEARSPTYAELCQRIEEALNTDFASENPHKQRNNPSPFLSALRLAFLREIDRYFSHSSLGLYSLVIFAADLLSLELFTAEDSRSFVGLLFEHVEKHDEYSIFALNKFARRVREGVNGLLLMEKLDLIQRIEGALKQSNIMTSQVKFILMGLLALSSRPEPVDAFGSEQDRAEVYGYSNESSSDISSENEEPPDLEAIYEWCEECTRAFFTTQSLSAAENYFADLAAEHRYILIDCLVHAALLSNDICEARRVASLFSLHSVRPLIRESATFCRGFLKEVEALEDTSLDVPHAYRMIAIMMYACGATNEDVEILALRIIHADDSGREHLLHEYFALVVKTTAPGFIVEDEEGWEPIAVEEGNEFDEEEGDHIAIAI